MRQAIRIGLTVAAVSSTALFGSCDDDESSEGGGGSSGGTGGGSAEPLAAVRGLADFHSHQFAHLGFGGNLHTHDVSTSAQCERPLNYSAESFRVKDLVREGLLKEATRQHDEETGACYPTAANLAGQQMDVESLRRAWRYGLRLLVVLAVNSEFLCAAADLADGNCPSDQAAIEAQLRAAHALQDQIDAAGGPGSGWYRIVTTPAEARTVIRDGKLAVVLGVEAANAFGCAITGTDLTLGIPTPIGTPNFETTWRQKCGGLPGALGTGTPGALALIERYWDLGARHFFPIHNLDGLAGGTALGIPILHAVQNPSRLKPGGIFNRVPDINRTIIAIRPEHSATNCSSRFEFDDGRCNKQSLSPSGVAIAKMLADYGAIIDVDHMSLRAKREFFKVTRELYPVVSSHSGVDALNHGVKDNEGQLTDEDIQKMITWGGAFAPILRPANDWTESDTYPRETSTARHNCGGTTESFIQTYRYIVAKLENAPTTAYGTAAFPGVGFGSDFNGLAGWPMPRWGRWVLGGGGDIGATLRGAFVGESVDSRPGSCYGLPTEAPRVAYPFKSPLTGENFDRSVLGWSGRTEPYDISLDGVAHVGMIPDFVEELRALLGCSSGDGACPELDPLWNGAEAYIQTWERAAAFSGNWTGEREAGIWEKCRGLRARLLASSETAEVRQTMAELAEAGCYASASTPVPVDDRPFGLRRDWTDGPFFGQRGTFFADVTGDDLADAIAVNDGGIVVRRSTGADFGPPVNWTSDAFYGQRGTFFADVTGDIQADAVAVNDDRIIVRRSSGADFGAPVDWTTDAFFGQKETFLADVTGDRRLPNPFPDFGVLNDAIAVNDGTIVVRRATGFEFGPPADWTNDRFFGQRGTFMADVTGDDRADAIAVSEGGITVRQSSGFEFGPAVDWTNGSFFGQRGTLMADVTGDGRADAVAVSDGGIVVRQSSGFEFGPPVDWTSDPFFGQRGTFFADVTGDERADAIAVNDGGIAVRRSKGG